MPEKYVRESIAEQLDEIKQPGETHGDLLERLLEEAGYTSSEDETEDDEEAEQLAGEVMNAADHLAADGSKAEYLKEEYDVDPSEYDDVEQLRAELLPQQRGDAD